MHNNNNKHRLLPPFVKEEAKQQGTLIITYEKTRRLARLKK